jgi:CubicO group peptidase (beta-lactamase class C family)
MLPRVWSCAPMPVARWSVMCRWAIHARYYDFASLTKIVFTQQALMQAFDRGAWTLQSTVGDFLPDFSRPASASPSCSRTPPAWNGGCRSTSRSTRRFLARAPPVAVPPAPGRTVPAHRQGGVHRSRLHAARASCWRPCTARTCWRSGRICGIRPTRAAAWRCTWTTSRSIRSQAYAPTELCPWRKKRLQGEVHDDNTWSFGGISTHAGLFGSIDDLAGYGLALRAQMRGLPGARVQAPPPNCSPGVRCRVRRVTGRWVSCCRPPGCQLRPPLF